MQLQVKTIVTIKKIINSLNDKKFLNYMHLISLFTITSRSEETKCDMVLEETKGNKQQQFKEMIKNQIW